jgi:hypothetical protein
MKSMELSSGRKIFLERYFVRCDLWLLSAGQRLAYWWSHVNFRNTKRVFFWIVTNSHRMAVAIKRRFDHEQSHFFTKREPPVAKRKGSVSFFLKNVSDFKKSLREGREE